MDELEEFERLREQTDAGKTLSPSERARYQALLETNSLLWREHTLLLQLRDLDVAVRGDDQVFVNRTLEALEQKEKVVPLRPLRTDAAAPGRPKLGFRPRLWRTLAAALVAAAGALSLWGVAHERNQPEAPALATTAPSELTLTSGEVRVNGTVAQAGAAPLQPRSIVRVVRGRACLSIAKVTDVCLEEGTEVELDEGKAGPRRLRLRRGHLAAALEKRPFAQRFSVVAGELIATAVGTAFSVQATQGAARVTVLDGHVEVTLGTQKMLLGQADRVSVVARTLVRSPAATRAELGLDWALLAARRFWAPRAVGILRVGSRPVTGQLTVDGISVGQAPLELLVPDGRHRVELELDGHVVNSEEVRVLAGGVEELQLILPEKPTTVIESTRRAPVLAVGRQETPAELLTLARGAVGRAKWREASSAYQRLCALYPSSQESRTVRVTLGQLQLERLGQPRAALASFDAYLALGGALAQEARLGRVRALQKLGERPLERQAIISYLKLYPGSLESAALGRRLLEL